MITINLLIFIFSVCFTFTISQTQQMEEREVRAPVSLVAPPEENRETEGFAASRIDTGCIIGGCYNELCMTSNAPLNYTCDYNFRNEFDCFRGAHCRMLEDGTCDWDRTTQLEGCLNINRLRENLNRNETLNENLCRTDGCYNQFCIDTRLAPMRLARCEFRPEFDCLRYTRCSFNGDRCDFEMNRDYMDCMRWMMRLTSNEMRMREYEMNMRENAMRMNENMMVPRERLTREFRERSRERPVELLREFPFPPNENRFPLDEFLFRPRERPYPPREFPMSPRERNYRPREFPMPPIMAPRPESQEMRQMRPIQDRKMRRD